MICNVLWNLHTISNNCAEYEHPWSKKWGGVRVTSHKLIVSIFDLIFWHQWQNGDKKQLPIYGWAALPCGATGLSAVCDCGISWSYSLTILECDVQNGVNRMMTSECCSIFFCWLLHAQHKNLANIYIMYYIEICITVLMNSLFG